MTPRFRKKLTVLDGSGQLFNSSEILIIEKSNIVILIYENSPQKTKSIHEIIGSYKRSFQQESVLRTISEVKISF
ncbi:MULTISPECIES: DUF3574 domain-containing protein [Microcoleaceae]|uniref:DUF3574 domain-containing protein n=1 Tax=Microcoleaceae TaxID=1892252 RepID=UPI002FD55A3B